MLTRENPREAPTPQLDLTAWIPDSAITGDRVECEWLLVNRGSEDALVGFYLHVSPGSIAQLACTAGLARRSRFHGSANLAIPAGKAVTVSARLQPQGAGDQEVRVVAVTRNEMIQRADTVAVAEARTARARRLPSTVRLVDLARCVTGAMPN